MLTIGLVTDIHFGRNTRFEGKLRKLCEQAPGLLDNFVEHMGDVVHPDFVVNLGDVIQDEHRDLDRDRYRAALQQLARAPCELVNVAGNHDTINLDAGTLRDAWGSNGDGPLYYAFDRGAFHFIVLRTIEHQDTLIDIDEDQLQWLAADLDAVRGPTVVLMHHSAADQDLSDNRWFSRTKHVALLSERQAFRSLLRQRGNVVAVFNGHLHWNHLYMADGIAYVTLQSLVENVEDDAPGRPAATHAVVRLTSRILDVQVHGLQPSRYRIELGR
jgi:Icc protein